MHECFHAINWFKWCCGCGHSRQFPVQNWSAKIESNRKRANNALSTRSRLIWISSGKRNRCINTLCDLTSHRIICIGMIRCVFVLYIVMNAKQHDHFFSMWLISYHKCGIFFFFFAIQLSYIFRVHHYTTYYFLINSTNCTWRGWENIELNSKIVNNTHILQHFGWICRWDRKKLLMSTSINLSNQFTVSHGTFNRFFIRQKWTIVTWMEHWFDDDAWMHLLMAFNIHIIECILKSTHWGLSRKLIMQFLPLQIYEQFRER